MESEERYLRERVGQERPFRVPEGYFDSLAARVMENLPAREQSLPQPATRGKSRLANLRPWLYAAACLAVVLVMSLPLLFNRQAEEQPVAAAAVENTYMDEAADYAMLDNAEIYACLLDN